VDSVGGQRQVAASFKHDHKPSVSKKCGGNFWMNLTTISFLGDFTSDLRKHVTHYDERPVCVNLARD
jgi:hypothetical protein